MIKKIELLVHAGAPSSRQDDEKYRAQAQAYPVFQGNTIEPLIVRRPLHLEDVVPAQEALSSTSSNLDNSLVNKHGETTFLEDTQLAYAALDSQLATSSLIIPADISPVAPIVPAQSSQDLQSSPGVCAEPTSAEPLQHLLGVGGLSETLKRKRSLHGSVTITDKAELNALKDDQRQLANYDHETAASNDFSQSSYLKSPVLDRPRKKLRVGPEPQRMHVLNQRARDIDFPFRETGRVGAGYSEGAAIAGTAPPILARSQASTGGDQTTSQLPTSYSLSDITTESSKGRKGISQRSSSDPGPQIGSISPTALRAVPTPRRGDGKGVQFMYNTSTKKSTAKNATEAPEQVTTREDVDNTNEPETILAARANAVVTKSALPAALDTAAQSTLEAKSSDQIQTVKTSHLAISELQALPTSIIPLEPNVALEKYTTHVTDALRYVAENTDINTSYRPVAVTREIWPMERGYWLVICPLDSKSWTLQEQIGFWRFLEDTVGSGRVGWGVWCTRNEDYCAPAAGRPTLGTLKVFCWGEIVRHVYLMLYVASKSKVRKLGLQWVDGDGKIVVQMRGS